MSDLIDVTKTHSVAATDPLGASRTRTAWGDVLSGFDDERGDVPGWVLITLMSAALVVVIWALAGPALSALFERAINSVNGI